MTAHVKTSAVQIGLAAFFLVLGVVFLVNGWGHLQPAEPVPQVDPQFTNTATVRMSAGDLYRTDGDTSGFSCYACHDEDKPVEVRFDEEDNIILSEDHSDITLRHGGHKLNNHCFNCHDATNLEMLRTRQGKQLAIEESNQLCASCHGPSHREWEAGFHGRLVGYWRKELGEMHRADCTSCHNPHAPAFPSMTPAPSPHRVNGKGKTGNGKEQENHE